MEGWQNGSSRATCPEVSAFVPVQKLLHLCQVRSEVGVAVVHSEDRTMRQNKIYSLTTMTGEPLEQVRRQEIWREKKPLGQVRGQEIWSKKKPLGDWRYTDGGNK